MISLRAQKPCYGVVMGVKIGADRIRWLSVNSDVVRDEDTGEVFGAIATFSDITPQINQKRYLEQALQELRAISQTRNEKIAEMAAEILSVAAEISNEARRLAASQDKDGR